MGNPQRGEVDFNVDGKIYTLLFSINALCELEAELGEKVSVIASQLDAPSLSMVRTVFWCGLREKQRDMTVEDAGRLIHAIGFAEAGDLIGKAFKLTFPEAPAKAARPPKAGRTTKAG